MSLRRILGLSFLLVCGLPLLFFWLWPHSKALEAELERAHERHLVLAQAAAETLEVYQDNVLATFAAIVEAIRTGTDLSIARSMLASQAFTHFCVVDAKTGEVLQSFSVAGRAVPDALPADLFAELTRRLGREGPQLGEVWMGGAGGPQFLLVEDLGETFVFASVNGSFLKRIADSVVFGQGGHMAILDAAGRVIAHPNPDWVSEVKDLSQNADIAGLLERHAPEVLVFFSPALQEDVVAGAAPVAGTGWRVLVPQPVSEVHATVVAGRLSALLVFSAGLALSALVALLAAAIITRPLKAVAAAADKMARGAEYIVVEALPSYAPRELRELGTSFNKMARRIERTVARMTMLARQDPNTGLLNKRSIEEAARERLATADGSTAYSLVLVDLNNLKSINDVYGHAAGDSAIRTVAKRLRSAFPPPSLVGRVGGDEFLVLTLTARQSSLLETLRPVVEGLPLETEECGSGISKVSCSVGVSNAPPGVAKLELLINEADEAMYFAKKRASGIQVYDQEMRAQTQRRFELAAQLKKDIFGGALQAAFQPIFCASSGEIVAFEALARWSTPRLGEIPPSEFLSIAQNAGILKELDRCVRREAFALARELQDRSADVPVAVNVTAPDLARADFMERFGADLKEAGLEGRQVIVEVTETIFDDCCGLATKTLAMLAEMGVQIKLDDFGKGFSSHGLLPFNSFTGVKIDLRFAGDPMCDERARAIVASLTQLGTQLGLTVTLEGIETGVERDFAIACGVDHVQGFLYGRPVGRSQALAMLWQRKLAPIAV